MNKEEIYEHLGYNTDLYNKLANIFELEEDYQDKAWDKLTEICKHIYKIEKENQQLKENECERIKYLERSCARKDTTIQENTFEIAKLSSQIDKAIAYIEQLEHSDWITFGRKILLEILKGTNQ